MAHNVCCDSYRVHNVSYIYYTIVIILGSLRDVCYFLWPLFTDWVVMSVVVVLVLLRFRIHVLDVGKLKGL